MIESVGINRHRAGDERKIGRDLFFAELEVKFPRNSGGTVDMPRMGRVVVPEYPHHIVQRGQDRNVVFASEFDFRYLMM